MALLKCRKPHVDPMEVAKPKPIDRAFFREAPDGSTVFFPWGLTHRGYRLADDAARRSASRAASLLLSSVMAIGVWTAHVLEPTLESEPAGLSQTLTALVAPGAALALVIAGYWLWASRFLEHCPESDLRVSRDERLREAAELASPRKVALVGMLGVGLSALLVVLEPRAWWLGLLGVASSLAVLAWARVLRRAAAPRR
jgi:hypothetical protein